MRRVLTVVLCFSSAQAFAQCVAAPAEAFQEFIAKFSESQTFAATRTLQPTYMLRHEFGEQEPPPNIKVPLTKAEVQAMPPIKQILSEHQMAMETREVTKKTAQVEVFKPNSDWTYTYRFVRKHGCWYLHHIENNSL